MSFDVDQAFARLMDGQCDAAETKAFLLQSIDKMRDPAWLVAGAKAMRARMIPIDAPDGAMDVCGTGGDGAHTLNISTAVTFVVAGCGVPVAKHGNRAMSSKCGAADVLEALGVKLIGDAPTLERSLREAGVAFLFAQNHHPSMRHVAAARREIGRRTIFNVLGPLSNPAGVKRQLLGVFAADLVAPAAEALRELGAEQAIVVHGAGGIDELTFVDVIGVNQAVLLSGGGIRPLQNMDVRTLAAEFELLPYPADALAGGDAAFNAKALHTLLEGRMSGSAYEATVLLNASAALIAAGKIAADDERNGWAMARDSIRSGAALGALEKLIALTSATP